MNLNTIAAALQFGKNRFGSHNTWNEEPSRPASGSDCSPLQAVSLHRESMNK